MANIASQPFAATPRVTIAIPFGIAINGTVSDVIEIPTGSSINAIVFPVVFTGTTVGFNGSADGVTFYPICDPTTGAPITLTVPTTLTAGAWAALPPATLCSARLVQLTCTSQTAARAMQAIPRIFS